MDNQRKGRDCSIHDVFSFTRHARIPRRFVIAGCKECPLERHAITMPEEVPGTTGDMGQAR
jgi:hypothetical protein